MELKLFVQGIWLLFGIILGYYLMDMLIGVIERWQSYRWKKGVWQKHYKELKRWRKKW